MIQKPPRRTPWRRRCLPALLLATLLPAQDWTDEQLLAASKGFLEESITARLHQCADLIAHKDQAFTAMCARIHGDYREYLLKIDRLLNELSDDRWSVREAAERALVEVGARARTTIEARTQKFTTLEESIRCKRILQALSDRGTEQEDRETAILRGLVMTSMYLDTDPRMLRALRSALGHTDGTVVDLTIRSLGLHGGDDEADAVHQMLDWKGGIYRNAALAALARMPCPKALDYCRSLLQGTSLKPAEACAMLRTLRQRTDAGDLVASLKNSADKTVAAAAALELPPATTAAAKVKLTLADKERTPLLATFAGLRGDSVELEPPVEVPAAGEGGKAQPIDGLPRILLSFADIDVLDFPDHPIVKLEGARVFMNQGSLVTGALESIDPESIKLRSAVFGLLTLKRSDVQGIAVDPELDRLVGGSIEHDRVRLKTNEFVDGSVRSLANGKVSVELAAGGSRDVPLADVAGILMTRPQTTDPDPTIYTRVDLINGDRILGFVCASTPRQLGITTPLLGAAVVPAEQLGHIELGVGGGAMWGFTLIADYSDNRVFEVDDQGRVVFEMNDVFGAWDAECLDSGNLLITEFSVSRVQEVDRKGNVIWAFDDLKNPYDADRLQNGNTLIADTFGGRVIEVTPDKKIVWTYDKEIRPFDCDRLANGNTLIADVLKDRVIEVSPAGEIVWEVKNMNNVHDADRLPNGNTLITLRSAGKVIEVDRDGKTVWELENLDAPGDADRLPNGHTLVAENKQVREFDRRGNVVWKFLTTWAVEVNRY